MNLSPARKTCLLFHSFYICKTKYHLKKECCLKVFLIISYIKTHKLSASLVKFNFLLSQVAYFYKSISFFNLFYNLGTFTFCYFLQFKQYNNVVLQINESIFWIVIPLMVCMIFIASFISSHSLNTFFTETKLKP